jgi:Family of unknown function (DUF6153)
LTRHHAEPDTGSDSVGGVRQRRQTVADGRLVRWLLLACTLVGLAAMHCLGHAGGAHAVTMIAEAGHAMATTAALDPAGDCGGDGCAHLAGRPGGGGGHDTPGWSVCLAIVSGFAALVLLAAALVTARRDDPAGVLLAGCGIGQRAPPNLRPVGLALATVSVLRR